MLVKIEEAVSGMKLAEDVFLPNGTTLINSSAILTENIISQLKKYGIEKIQVVQEVPSEEDQPEQEKKGEPDREQESLKEESPDQSEEPETPSDTDEEAKEYTLPKITVLIENEGLSAYLRIEPMGAQYEKITVDDIKDALMNENVLFGINEPLIEEAVKKWQQSKNIIEIENIAQGISPTPAKESDLELTVKHINNTKDLESVKAADYCWELLNSAIPIQQVDNVTVIAKKEIKTPSIPGQNIFGDPIDIDEVIITEVKLGDNAEEDKESKIYTSTVTGLAYYIDGKLGVEPINFDGSAEISVSPDKMKAELIIHPAVENGTPPSEKSVKNLLSENNISFGVDETKLTDILKNMGKGVYPDGPVTIAEGVPPTPGENGKTEYFFNTETSLKPKEDTHGKVDFKNVSIIQSVNKGDKLAQLTPPTEGKPGKDIFGNENPFTEGTTATLPAGANTMPDPQNESILIASTDGNVRLNKNVVEIYEGFVIKGDVDYSTGNVEYDKSVSIKGDIKSGFIVKCGGDLEVGGTIEDSRLQIGGNLLCKYGFIGQGKGIIECKGDVNIGFMKNQTIRCRNNVNIAREALNCKIFARKTVTVSGKSISIAGGSVIARDSIVCNVLGNSSGINTSIEVGLDYTLIEEMEKTEKQLNEIAENRHKLLEALKRLEQTLATKKKLTPKEEFLYAKLKNTITKYNSQVITHEKRKKIIASKMHMTDKAFIKIEHSAMPGTLIKIGDHHHYVHQEIIGPKTVRLVNYEIRII